MQDRACADTPLPTPAAHAVLLLRAYEQGPPTTLWSDDDARWATRLADDSDGASTPALFVAARARHALERLTPREPRIAALRRGGGLLGADGGGRRWRWELAVAVLVGAFAGLGIDHIGHSQHINLLAPPVWGVVVWNLVVGLWFAGRLVTTGLARLAAWRRAAPPPATDPPRTRLQRWLSRRLLGSAAPADPETPLARFAADWARARAPFVAARMAVLLHVAAVALALGMTAGLYLRGLVLDYSAGWQSTFLDAEAVQRGLDTSLAPASRLTGIAVPDVAPLRWVPAAAPAPASRGPAAPWIHLYAATLLLFVVAPRGLLALAAAQRSRRLAQAVPLPLHDAYFQRLLAARAGHAPRVLVVPAAALDAGGALRLREALVARFGAQLQLQIAAPAGSDDEVVAAAEPGTQLVTLADLATTPEAEIHGRRLDVLGARSAAGSRPPSGTRPGAAAHAAPPLIVLDTGAFHRRFAALPARIAERKALWRRFAAERGVECLFVDLGPAAAHPPGA